MRFRLLIWAALVAVLAAGAGQTLEAQTGTITGLVRAADTSAPLIAAIVQVNSAQGDRVTSVITGPGGRYSIPNLPAGRYSVTVLTTGYATTRRDGVTVTAGGGVTADFALEMRAIDLDPISVTASRGEERALDAPARVEVVGPAEIAETPVIQPTDHLRNLPGVDIVSQGLQATNVVTRGFNNVFSGALLALTDHRIAAIPSLRVNSLYMVPTSNDDIERMEVVLGPGSALYGPNTANGVLQIFTRSPLTWQGTSVSLAGGGRDLFQGSARTARLLTENLGVKVSTEYFRGREWEYTDPTEEEARIKIDDPTSPIGQRDLSAERWMVDARADWRLSDDAIAVFSAGRSTQMSGIELTGLGAAQLRNWAYGYYQARINWNRLFAQAYLNTSDSGDTYTLRDGVPTVDQSRFAVLQLQHAWSPVSRQNFIYGVDYQATTPRTGGTISGRYEDHDNYSEVGAFLQSETALSSKLELVLAGRFDRHSVIDQVVFSPRAALVFKPLETQTIRASYNRAYSNPGSVQLFLDKQAGPISGTLGQLGYNLRAEGVGVDGIRFQDDAGNNWMRSPFGPTPGTLLEVNAQNVWQSQVRSFAAVLAGNQTFSQAQAAAFEAFMLSQAPGDIAVYGFNPLTPSVITPFTGTPDVPEIRESNNTTWELGYTGLFSERLLLGADLWHTQRDNFISPLIPRGGFVLLDPAALGAYAQQRISQFLQAGGAPPDVANATAAQMAAGMAQIPGGVVSSPEFNLDTPDLLLSYQNFGDIKLWGTDLSAQVIIGGWNARVSASFVSDDHFGSGADLITLNSATRKGSVSLGYRDDARGLGGEVRVRHSGEFPVNSGVFVGMQCLGTEYASTDSCVPSATLTDLTMSWQLPRFSGASVQLSVQNVFNSENRSFVGTPDIGRMALARLRYEF
ncbi:MAG: TonB-dependent receptor [Gemmatimonadota bacterium]|jgi:iron complex outermembrane receptor protein|nr:TonB-dependent receptor [Gemmatimonadota bacterium]